MVRCGGVRVVLVVGFLVLALPDPGSTQAPAGRGAIAQTRVHSSMLQVMRAILYPASNVIFTAQTEDPASFKPATRTSTSSDPFTSAYGGWEAVENAGLALAESANLLTIPGRLCGNGRPAPIQIAGMAASKAALTKNQDTILEAAGVVAEACLHCHQKYRQGPGGFAGRCQ